MRARWSDQSGTILFTKSAGSNWVKTRLRTLLPLEQRRLLHAAMRDDVLRTLDGGSWEVRVAWDPDSGSPADLARPSFVQRGEDLGERMYNALLWGDRYWRRTAIVGSDHPELTSGQVEQAFAALGGGADLVLGPATDGGFYLIASRRGAKLDGLLRDVQWSRGDVFDVVRKRTLNAGLRFAQLDPVSDIDTPDDVERLAARLQKDLELCPRTRSVLQSLGFLPKVSEGRYV